jgi:hypothetical protein
MPLGDAIGLPATQLHSVWGRVVADIPDFCRELVAALAEELKKWYAHQQTH